MCVCVCDLKFELFVHGHFLVFKMYLIKVTGRDGHLMWLISFPTEQSDESIDK